MFLSGQHDDVMYDKYQGFISHWFSVSEWVSANKERPLLI